MNPSTTSTSTTLNPSTINDTKDIFELLESPQQFVVEDIKSLIQENINSTKDSWLVNGLYDYFIQFNSQPCMEILLGISREPQDKFLIEKIIESLRSQQSRKASVIFLGHLVRKQPSWLYKIVTYGLVKELIKFMKYETDIIILMSGLLILTTILPMLPTYLISFINDIFDVFGRLAVWTQSPNVHIEEHLLHIQVGLYSLFHRLYAMFPCNFLSYLRHNFSVPDKRHVFLTTIKPMLETVKMHPLLVTATKEWEMSPNRWRNKEFHDIIAEYSEISLDVLESGSSEEFSPITLRPRLSTCTPATETSLGQKEEKIQITALPISPLVQQALKSEELTSISTNIDEASNAGGIPQTPLSTTSQMSVQNTPNITHTTTKTTTSPPEVVAGVEATPENTPISGNTPIKERERTHFKLPTTTTPVSPAVTQLNFGKGAHSSLPPPQTPPPTPYNSVPSSPAPLPLSGTGEGQHHLHRRDSIFDSGLRRESVMYQRLQKCMLEQQQQQSSQHFPTRTEESGQSAVGGNKPSPLTLGDAVITLEPIPGSSQADSLQFAGTGVGGDGPLTPLLGTHLDETNMMDENGDELTSLQSVIPEVHHQMPDTRSMIAFAKRVSRLRYYSHCVEPTASSTGHPSPGTSPSSTSFMTFIKTKRSNSCPDVRKKSILELDESMTDSVDGSSTTTQQPQEHDEEVIEQATMEPYEHLFEGVLPQFLQHPENKKSIQSPHVLLDLCIAKAASLHAPRKGDELAMLSGQVELLHCQLLFERHRRESHALRNRQLAKRCRHVQQKEEQNCALRSQLHNMEKEVAILKKEVIIQKTMTGAKEKEFQQIIKDLENKLQQQKIDNKTQLEQISNIELKHTKMFQEYQALLKETDQRKADIFQLESEVKHCKKFITINNELKAAYESSQREILLLGELIRRQQEVIGNYEPHRYLIHEMEDLRLTCEDEIKSLKNILDTKASQTEAALGFIKNLEEQILKKDAILADQKKLLLDSSSEYEIQIKALEDKYASVKKCNQRLEFEILNLQHQLSLKSLPIRTANNSQQQRSRISPNGESPHNSNTSDVDSAASAGGMQLSPDRSMLIFGSLQFDSPTGGGGVEMNDLQRVIESEGEVGPGPSTSRRIQQSARHGINESHANNEK